MPSEIKILHSSFPKPSSPGPSFGELIQAIIGIVGRFESIWMFVDALDEFDMQKLNQLLSGLCQLVNAGINVFATCRPHIDDIADAFKSGTTCEITADEEDVGIFVRSKFSSKRFIKAPIVEQITSKIVEKAGKMWVFVYLP